MRNLFAVVVLLAVALIVSPSDTEAFQGTDTDPIIENFYLVNLTTGREDVRILQDNDVIDLEVVTFNWNIRVETEPNSVSRVEFELSGDRSDTHIERFLPYAFPRDNDPLNLPVGNYQLTATAYSTDGTAGPPLILNFSVIVGTDTPPEIVSTDPEPDAAIVPDANIMLTFSKPVDVGLSGNWLTISCTPSNTNLTASDTTVTVS
ncbi:MAG: Ig-like domain-containing protein, partial [Chloroflexota bacterium]